MAGGEILTTFVGPPGYNIGLNVSCAPLGYIPLSSCLPGSVTDTGTSDTALFFFLLSSSLSLAGPAHFLSSRYPSAKTSASEGGDEVRGGETYIEAYREDCRSPFAKMQ